MPSKEGSGACGPAPLAHVIVMSLYPATVYNDSASVSLEKRIQHARVWPAAENRTYNGCITTTISLGLPD